MTDLVERKAEADEKKAAAEKKANEERKATAEKKESAEAKRNKEEAKASEEEVQAPEDRKTGTPGPDEAGPGQSYHAPSLNERWVHEHAAIVQKLQDVKRELEEHARPRELPEDVKKSAAAQADQAKEEAQAAEKDLRESRRLAAAGKPAPETKAEPKREQFHNPFATNK